MSAVNGPGGLYQSRWEHAQVTTASCRLTEAKCWLNKEEVEPTKRAEEARKLINVASNILSNMGRLNSTWRQNDLYTGTEVLAQRLLQDVARLLEGRREGCLGG